MWVNARISDQIPGGAGPLKVEYRTHEEGSKEGPWMQEEHNDDENDACLYLPIPADPCAVNAWWGLMWVYALMLHDGGCVGGTVAEPVHHHCQHQAPAAAAAPEPPPAAGCELCCAALLQPLLLSALVQPGPAATRSKLRKYVAVEPG
jgi:hypothetical protein